MGHHIIPFSLFAKGPRSNPKLLVSREAFRVFNEARIANEFYNFHNYGPANGVSHPDFTKSVRTLLNDFREEVAKELKYKKGRILPMGEIDKKYAQRFVEIVEKADGEIKQFLDGVRYQADMAEAIGKKGGAKAVLKWRTAYQEVEKAKLALAKIASGATDVGEEPMWLKYLAKHQKRADDIAAKYLSKSTMTKLAKRLAKNKILRKAGKTALSVLPGVTLVAGAAEDGWGNAAIDEATDFIPFFWPVKAVARELIGEEEWARGRDMTWEERGEAFTAGWAALCTRSNKRERGESVNELTIASGQTITVGRTTLGETEFPERGQSTVTHLYRVVGHPGEAIAVLADGRVLEITTPILEIRDP